MLEDGDLEVIRNVELFKIYNCLQESCNVYAGHGMSIIICLQRELDESCLMGDDAVMDKQEKTDITDKVEKIEVNK